MVPKSLKTSYFLISYYEKSKIILFTKNALKGIFEEEKKDSLKLCRYK